MRHEVYDHLSQTNVLITDRLILKRMVVKDALLLFEVASDPRVSEYLLWDPHPSLKYTKRYLKNIMRLYKENKYYEWGVYLKDTYRLIGTCGFTAFDLLSKNGEIGYSFGYSFWGKGYATEAVKETIRYGFEELGLERITACYALINQASAHVLEKNNMNYISEGDHMIIKGREHRICYHAITKDEYLMNVSQNTTTEIQPILS